MYIQRPAATDGHVEDASCLLPPRSRLGGGLTGTVKYGRVSHLSRLRDTQAMQQSEIDYAKRDPNSRARAKVLNDAICALCAFWCAEHGELEPTVVEREEAALRIVRALEVLSGS